ncbi:MAG: membrane dipeptidase [Deltaproteobacteria bacterium]|nr:membrane dipeptidase [Deltaproteobacteria bacterium]
MESPILSPQSTGKMSGYAFGAEDISAASKFVSAMAARGYSEDDRMKIMGGNFLRIYTEGLPD